MNIFDHASAISNHVLKHNIHIGLGELCRHHLFLVFKFVDLTSEELHEIVIPAEDRVLDQVIQESLKAVDTLLQSLRLSIVVLAPQSLGRDVRDDAPRFLHLQYFDEPLEVRVSPVNLFGSLIRLVLAQVSVNLENAVLPMVSIAGPLRLMDLDPEVLVVLCIQNRAIIVL